jgi:hypothetical protein
MAFLSFRRDGDTRYALRKAVLPVAFHISVIRAAIAEFEPSFCSVSFC